MATTQSAKKQVAKKASQSAPTNSGGNGGGEKKDAAIHLIDRLKKPMANALPQAVPPERFARVSLTLLRRQPELLHCSQESLMGGLMTAAQLGLEPGPPLGQCWLVPFWDKKTQQHEATFILGYTGLIELARRSGSIETIVARPVHEGDHFDVEYGLNEKLEHKPDLEAGDDRALKYVYALAKYVGGGHNFVVLSKGQVDSYRKRSKASDSGPWVTDYEAMALKTAVRRMRPFLPMSIEMKQAFSADEQTARLYSGEEDSIIDVSSADEFELEAGEPPDDADPETGETSPPPDAADGDGGTGADQGASADNDAAQQELGGEQS